MRFKITFLVNIFLLFIFSSNAQSDRWQQHVEYQMDIDFNVKNHRFKGKQELKYFNNSPDTLYRVFYHLYFNAFQPGSMMQMHAFNTPGASYYVGATIEKLEDSEIGYQKIESLKQDGKSVDFEVVGTILEVNLEHPLLPHESSFFRMDFEAQVPIQIRRSGRDNYEGIDYSMAQWYPKMCEYDYQGWHANPYIAREFYGVWGDYDVKISIDENYIVAASGYLQNPEKIGYGYGDESKKGKKGKNGKLTWHFVAPNVHDFVWAADPDYEHTVLKRKDGLAIHFFYQKNKTTEKSWSKFPEVIDKAFDYINKTYGQYQYKKYSFIQGGDGGMEYPMATLISGNRGVYSLVGVAVHELMHSWFQMMLGSNESLHAWMDEGFTSYAAAEVMNHLKEIGALYGGVVENPHKTAQMGYLGFVISGAEEPLTTHADHFQNDGAYWMGAYNKGEVLLYQLQYIVGKQKFDEAMLRYFDVWKFKHPNPNDFIRVFEKVSGLELDWYKEYFVQTTYTIDYGITSVEKKGNRKTEISLKKIGVMPMPIDVVVTYKNGKKDVFNIPLRIMRGEKEQEFNDMGFSVLKDWPWIQKEYKFVIDKKINKIKKVEIDPSGRMVDVDKDNNVFFIE